MKRKITTADVALIFIGVMVAWAAIGGAAGLVMTKGFDLTHRPPPTTRLQASAQIPPEPRLQADPLADRRVMVGPDRRAAGAGPGHIPVDEAMRILAAKGWPETAP